MSKPLQSVLAFFLLILAGCAIFVSWRVARTLQSFDDAAVVISNTVSSIDVGDVGGTVDRLNATLDAINAPCTGFHGSSTCGVLAQAAQTEKNIGILAGQSALQVKQSSALVDSAAGAITSAAADVHALAENGSKTLNAATGLTVALSERVPGTVDKVDSLLGHSDAAVAHFDALITSPDIASAMHHAEGMTASGDTILGNVAEVSTKAKTDYMKARTPWGRFVTTGLDLIHLGAYAAR